ncbi:retention module-containing protein [Thioalkalivibrio sp. ALJ3]|uniref:retention module-containing protein n=1 Tax=Thioalkalivibrio sp. ALJ3 TaxID=1240557 RepID=UPI00035C9A00|nr:retention module-containing protein [Thioalkalivibrio sp. ALJ3]
MSEVVVATVESVVGTVIARDEDGNTRVLQPGDEIFYGEEVIAEDGAFIEMAFEDGSTMSLAGNESATITDDLAETAEPAPEEGGIADATVEEIIAALDRGEDITDIIEAPAAGADGGAAGEGGGFVRIARGSEEVGQIEYTYDPNALGGPGEADGEGGGTLAGTDDVDSEPSLVIAVTPVNDLVSRVGSDIRPLGQGPMAALAEQGDMLPSEQPGAGMVVFSLGATLDLDGLPESAAGPIAYEIVGGDSAYLEIGSDADGNPAIVLTEQGAWALQNGQVPNNELSVDVQGTVEIDGIGLVSATDSSIVAVEVPEPTFDFQLLPGEVFPMPPQGDLGDGKDLGVQALNTDVEGPFPEDLGFPSSEVEEGMTVFWINPQADFDGIDESLGQFTYEIVGGDVEYLELSQDEWGQWSVALTEAGAEAIQNGQVSGNDLSVTIEGTLIIGENLVNTFTLEASAEGGVLVPVPSPELTIELSMAEQPEGWPQSADEGDVVFEVTADLELDGIDEGLAGNIALTLTEDSNGFLTLDGNNVVLTKDGATAIRNGQLGLDGLIAAVEGTVTIAGDDVNPFVLSDDAQAAIDEVPVPNPELTVELSAVDAPEGWPQSADAGDVVFEISTDLDLDGIDSGLAGEIALSLTEDSNGYLALDGNHVVLTANGAEAIRNGQVSGNELAATVEGTVTIAEDGVNPFELSDQASAVTGVPVPGPEITGLGEKDFFFDEKHLENGTNPDSAQLVKSGSFALVAPAGIASLAIVGTLSGNNGVGATEEDGSVVLTLDQLQALGESNTVSIETDNGNLLTLTGFDSDTGEVSFDLEFREPIEHPDGQGRNLDWKEAIKVALTDDNDQVADDTIDVLIRDDAPVFEGGEGITLSGSVTESPIEGNNGLNIGADIDGAFIKDIELAVNDDGHLVALLDGEEVLLTSRGEQLTLSFDSDTATLTAFNTNGDPVFTIQAGLDGSYSVNVLEPIDPVARSSFDEESLTSGGGIDDDLFVFDNGLEVQFASDNGAVNWSGSGIGVANNLISGGQTLSASFNQYVTDLDFTMGNQGTPSWEIYRDGDLVGSGNSLSINEPGGFDEIRFLGASGGNQYNIKGMSGTYMDASESFELPVTFHAEDGDGDDASHVIPIVFDPAVVDFPESGELLSPLVSVAVDSEEGQETVLKDDFEDLGVGGSGDGIIDDPNPPADTETLMFDFGQANAGQSFTLTWTQQAKGGWEDGNPDNLPSWQNRGGTRDTFKVFANGEEIYETSWYDPDNADDTVFDPEDESLTVVLDENGRAEIMFEVRSTHPDEVVDVSNIQGQLDVTSTIYTVSLDGSIDDPGEIDYYQLEVQGGELLVNGNVQTSVDGLYTVDPADITGLTVRPDAGANEIEVSAQAVSTDGVWSDVDIDSTEVVYSSAVTAVDNLNTAYVGESLEEHLSGREKGTDWAETREFTIGEGYSGSVAINAEFSVFSSGIAGNGEAELTWALFLEDSDDGEVLVGNGVLTRDSSQGSEFNVPMDLPDDLGPGHYRLELTGEETNDGSWFLGSWGGEVGFSEIVVGQQVDNAVHGNVITDEDAEGNSDEPGSDSTTLSIFDGDGFVEVDGEHTVAGEFGSLTLAEDGTYTYTASNDVANAGSIETFDYKLTHPNGDEAVATLSIRIDSPDVEVIWGDDVEPGATIAGSEADEILVGTSGADQIAAGAGNDILIGGDGADTFIWPGDVAGDVPSTGDINSGAYDPDAMPRDVVRDFTVDSQNGFTGEGEADQLDLSDLLVGADADNVDEYILAEEDGDGNTVLYVRTEGDTSPGNSGNPNNNDGDWAHNQSIVLEGVSMDGQSSADFVKQLMDNDQLKIDQ